MRLVVPVSRSDMHLLPEFVELHQHLKTAGLHHTLHFVVPVTLQSEARDAQAALDGLFEKITVHVLDWEPYGGWPYAPNMHFWACAKAMVDHNDAIPWQLVELDCRPIRASAYDVIAAKYASCGAPFFGYIGKTPWRTDKGQITKSLWGEGDEMMSGCAIYPGNLVKRPQLAGLMEDFMKGEMSIGDPWDMHLRSAMKAEGMAHTELIGNHWNTELYRVATEPGLGYGRLFCNARKEHEIYSQHPDWPHRECGGYIHPDAVMIHGCKDESLSQLVISGGIPETHGPLPVVARPGNLQQEGAKEAEGYRMPAISSPAVDARIDKLEGMMERLLLMLSPSATKNSAGPDAATGDPSRTIASPGVHETKAPADSQPPCYEPGLIPRLLEKMPGVGDKRMLGKLAAALNTKKDFVKAAVEATGKFTIRGPAEWVERIAA